MVIGLFSTDDPCITVEMRELFETRTLFSWRSISEGNYREVVMDLLKADLKVIIPDDPRRHNEHLLRALQVLRLMKVRVQEHSLYLQTLKLNPAAARAASPTEHGAAVGEPMTA